MKIRLNVRLSMWAWVLTVTLLMAAVVIPVTMALAQPAAQPEAVSKHRVESESKLEVDLSKLAQNVRERIAISQDGKVVTWAGRMTAQDRNALLAISGSESWTRVVLQLYKASQAAVPLEPAPNPAPRVKNLRMSETPIQDVVQLFATKFELNIVVDQDAADFVDFALKFLRISADRRCNRRPVCPQIVPRAYSTDLRQRVVQAYRVDDQTYPELADRFDVSYSSVKNWVQLMRTTGNVEPERGRQGGNNAKLKAHHEPLLRELVKQTPDATHAERCAEFQALTGIAVSESAMCKFLTKLGFTRKKSRPSTPNTTTRRFNANSASSASRSPASTPSA